MTDSSNDMLIKIRGLCFSRGQRVIFDNIDMDIPRGKVTAIMGPSGTGKTTLLSLIGRQLRPQAGSLIVDGMDVNKVSLHDLYQLRKKIGMLFQSGALLTDLTVFENVAFPLREHTQLPESLIHHLVLMKLHAVGLRNARHLMPSQLSGGMARRVALARALVLDPMMIMYDEPFTGQDPISMGVLVRLISSINKSLGVTSLIVSHDIHETASIADKIYIISNGKVVGEGHPDELKQSESAWVRQFMNAEPDGPVPFHYQGVDYQTDLLGAEQG
ncbi:ABC-type transport system involved in resistance to organic solvents, ATPase component [Beggiatoa alba B18LD]|uniref:ABC-type transport system involved in resistance to organic solvents, ATPase component n=1 Tax=Beggiatoa alba B18LD TaxID=395493 RepID=I3CFU1_9GAMM|nr:ATP-binding cassette domain-containing protein [Beggiatoa alba]EIJ42484.1 ABC-type transport system involved in resistance to organic solvents, ATPase component [Beggiatoa alba B18LD]